MKKYKSILLITALISSFFSLTGCREDLAQLNSDPSDVTKAEPSYLFAQAVINFEPSGYTYWFYNAAMTYKWGQMGVPTSGFTSTYTETTATGDQGFKYLDVLSYARDLEHLRSTMTSTESAKYENMAACLDVLTVYLGIFDSDMYGDRPFTEACKARYGGTLTPKYDKISDLYTLWLSTLDNAITSLTTATEQTFPTTQDVIYKGDKTKWAKLANSLKLKIAVRLLTQKKSEALQIASAVAKASCGVLDGENDDFLFNKANAITSDDGDKVYHWNNGFLESTAASQRVINFMIKNEDPRVRFFFRKNQWNSKIVQAFFDAGKNVPSYVLNNVEYTENSGKKTFVKWKGLGEPWVRYYGLPVEMDAANNAQQYGDYFDYSNRFKLTSDHSAYLPYSMFQQEMIIGRYDFTLPTVPGDPVIQDTKDNPWYGMYMSTAEVNLYLAEFKLLGADLPNSASSYFSKALKSSVEEYDRLANLNKIPYYGTTYNYDPNEKVIDLQSGETDEMLTNTDYQLTGDKSSDLEKVYLQELLHFMLFPCDQFVTVRRSGYPKEGSALIKWENYSPFVPNNAIPRRFEVSSPSPTDLMYNILIESYQSQGFTPGSAQAGTLLNSERVWQDVGAPQFGSGTNN